MSRLDVDAAVAAKLSWMTDRQRELERELRSMQMEEDSLRREFEKEERKRQVGLGGMPIDHVQALFESPHTQLARTGATAGDSTLDAMREELAQLRMGRGPSGLVGPAAPLTAQAKRDGAVQPPSRSPSSAAYLGSLDDILNRYSTEKPPAASSGAHQSQSPATLSAGSRAALGALPASSVAALGHGVPPVHASRYSVPSEPRALSAIRAEVLSENAPVGLARDAAAHRWQQGYVAHGGPHAVAPAVPRERLLPSQMRTAEPESDRAWAQPQHAVAAAHASTRTQAQPTWTHMDASSSHTRAQAHVAQPRPFDAKALEAKVDDELRRWRERQLQLSHEMDTLEREEARERAALQFRS